MRFLADESCDFGVVRALRRAGHDVEAVAEKKPGIADLEVSERARVEGRILVTEDKDFGQLVFASGRESPGVILIRYPGNARSELLNGIVGIVQRLERDLGCCFVVVQPGRIRVSRVPAK